MKKRILIVLGIILIVIGIVIGISACPKVIDEETAGIQEYDKIRAEVRVETEDIVSPVPQFKEPVIVPIDFESLTEQYPDVYAWIEIPGTGIDYPILQREGDNGYYLNHNIDGVKSIAGAIYTEDYNSKDFSDPNTVIYGHNMKNGSMFKQLHKFRDREFFNENREIIIYQEGRILTYKIFATYVYDNRHILLSFDFSDVNVHRSYISQVMAKKGMMGNIDDSVSVTTDDKILTLSTCTGNDKQRYLVQAVLLSIKE